MSIKIMDMVGDRAFKNATDKNVLMAIANHASDDGTGAWASHQSLGDRAGVSRETAGRAIARLEAAKLITKAGKKVRGSAWTHDYSIDLPTLYSLPRTVSAQAALDRLENREVTERHNAKKGREVTLTQEGSDADTPREVTERHTNRQEPSLTPPSPPKGASEGDLVWMAFPLAGRVYRQRFDRAWGSLSAAERTAAVKGAVAWCERNPQKSPSAYIRQRGWTALPAEASRPSSPDLARLHDQFERAGALSTWRCWLTEKHIRIEGSEIIPLTRFIGDRLRKGAVRPELIEAAGLTVAQPKEASNA